MSEQADPPIPAQFLAELSHELRTPLSAIIGFADAMRSQAFGPLSIQYTDQAEYIHAAGRHMLDLIEAMTNLGQVDDPMSARPRTLFDVRDAMREAADLFVAANNALHLDLPPEPVMIKADALAIRRILINLLANAIRATAGEGRVMLSAAREGATVVVRVEDDGPGMPVTDAPAAGQGLGLALARALSRTHGGDLHLMSAQGAGVVAIVRLPVAPET